ncbi:MAG TPA: hypothetical protein VGR25_08270 [bacterium]|jgi:hypothetical protein|nr:hypothetical protein [bacterium]
MMRILAAALVSALVAISPAPATAAGKGSGSTGSAEAQGPGGAGAPGAVVGVVLAQAGGTLTLLARGNTLLTVIIAGTAAVSGASGKRSPRDNGIARASVIEVAGPRNSDGSLSAQKVAVLFDARGAPRASGRIARPAQDGGLVLTDGTVVELGDDVWILRGTSLVTVGALTPGVAVTVYGTARGGRLVARVIEVSL